AVHELAHLLLLFPEDSPLRLEKRCDLFASFFLLPKLALIEELGSKKREKITLEEMIDIKELYGASLAASIIA
ncbi:transcriptional regulator, partial [Acinetobacter baumannii]